MANCEKILIAGFSGAGKTSFLRELERLASHPKWIFSDLDELVFKKHKKEHGSLAELIEEVGWERFRSWEKEELLDWIRAQGHGVLALGGGTLTPEILKLPGVKFYYLHADFETCWKRLQTDQTQVRPLVLRGKEELRKIYEERQPIFQKISWRVENSQDQILSELAQDFWERVHN